MFFFHFTRLTFVKLFYFSLSLSSHNFRRFVMKRCVNMFACFQNWIFHNLSQKKEFPGNYFGGYSTIYSLRLRDSRDSRDSQDSETPETPRLPRLRDSRGFCHITFQFSFISDLPLFQIFQILQILK